MDDVIRQTPGDISTAVSGGGAILSLFADSMPVLQFIAVCVSIVAGIYAIRFYSRKIDQIDNGKDS